MYLIILDGKSNSKHNPELLRKELNNKIKEIQELLAELSKKKVETSTLECKIDEKDEALKQSELRINDLTKELELVKNKLKDFEIIFDNPEMVIETKRQLEESKTECEELKKAAEESANIIKKFDELKIQKNKLVKDQIELKACLFNKENQLLKSNSIVNSKEKYKVFEELKNILIELLSSYVTMNTIAREIMIVYNEKLDKAIDYDKTLNEYLKENDKKERIKKSEKLEDSLMFLSNIPKKATKFVIIDDCVVNMLKLKSKKRDFYKSYVDK